MRKIFKYLFNFVNMTKNYLLLYLAFYKSINNERIQSYEYKKSKRRY